MPQDYITEATKVRVFFEDTGWAIDGADDDGGFTEAIWDHYDDERMSRETAVQVAPEFATEHGWGHLPIVLLADGTEVPVTKGKDR